MDEKELLYLAGFIDGEGCIGACLIRGYGKRAYNTTPRQQIRLSATNTTKSVLDDLRLAFGGCVSPHHQHMFNRKDCWRWTLVSKRASQALALLLPYLRIKRRQAELCLELQATCVEASIERIGISRNGRHLFASNRVKPEVETRRKAIVAELNHLNMRGT